MLLVLSFSLLVSSCFFKKFGLDNWVKNKKQSEHQKIHQVNFLAKCPCLLSSRDVASPFCPLDLVAIFTSCCYIKHSGWLAALSFKNYITCKFSLSDSRRPKV